MKVKNGFVFIETMVTVVVLSTALLVIYSLFSNILIKEHRRAYYDDPLYVYRANYLTRVFQTVMQNASTYYSDDDYVSFSDILTTYNNGVKSEVAIKMFTCDTDLFSDYDECYSFFYFNQIYRIYVTKYDLSFIDSCASSNSVAGDCIYYKGLNKQAKNYIKQLPYVPGVSGYYVVFEFYDDGLGGVCSSDKCMHQFASVKFGGNNKVINLNE